MFSNKERFQVSADLNSSISLLKEQCQSLTSTPSASLFTGFFFFWQCLCRLDWVSFTSSCVSVSRRSVICLRGRVDLQQHNKNQIGYLFSVALAEQGAPPPTISPYRAISAGRGRLTHTHNVNLAPVVLVRLYCFSGRPTCWPVASGSCTVKQTDPYLLLQGWKTRTWVSSDSRCVCVCGGGGGGVWGGQINIF